MLDGADEATLSLMGEYTIEDVVGIISETMWWAMYWTMFNVATYIQLCVILAVYALHCLTTFL